MLAPHVYLDMDGVIADFDSAKMTDTMRSKMADVVASLDDATLMKSVQSKLFPSKSYSNDEDRRIAIQGAIPTVKEKINQIMSNDKTYADYFSKILAVSGDQVVKDFFTGLDFLSGGQRVVVFLSQNRIPFTVLSAPLAKPASNATVEAKRIWLKNHIDQYNPSASSEAIFDANKYKYAVDRNTKQPNILIDDRRNYIDPWISNGGIGILYTDPSSTIQTLKKYYPTGSDDELDRIKTLSGVTKNNDV